LILARQQEYYMKIRENQKQRETAMCESNAYLIKNGQEELVMESVNLVKPQGEKTWLKSIFGEEMTINASVREMDLTGHRILLERT